MDTHTKGKFEQSVINDEWLEALRKNLLDNTELRQNYAELRGITPNCSETSVYEA